MDNLPDVIRIEPVGLCNFNCQHCPTGVSPNKRALLSKDKWFTKAIQWYENFILFYLS